MVSVRNLQRKVKIDTPLLKRVGERTLQALELSGAECGLILVDDARIARLKAAYLGEEKATDVLSFPLAEGRGQKGRIGNRPVLDLGPPTPNLRPLLGDVVISLETAERQAVKHRRSVEEEAAHLLVHGILHLVGYDHPTSKERRRMRRLERRFLAACFPRKRQEA